jgi:proline iminopeptidase
MLQQGEGYIERDGLRLHYRTEGHGPVCLAHPGGPGADSRYFFDLAGLSSFLTVLFFDPRGSELSPSPADSTRYRLTDYAADVEALRLHLGLDSFILLGHSFGGFVAQEYALTYPHGLSHLILANTTPSLSGDAAKRLLAAVEKQQNEPWYPAARAAFDKIWAGDFATGRDLGELVAAELPFYFREWNAAAQRYGANFEGITVNVDAVRYFNLVEAPKFDFHPRLREIQIPTLVLTGEDDFICDIRSAQETASLIPNAELCIMPGCGHYTFVDNPELFRETIRGFINRRSAETAHAQVERQLSASA